METTFLWMDGAHDPFFNMAVDEVLLNHLDTIGHTILRIYSWNVPAASFGYSQKPAAVTRKGLTLVRRPTGGGVVYHDCDLTYSLLIPASHPVCSLNRMESYRVVHEPIMHAILKLGRGAHLQPDLGEKHDRATLQCFVSPSPNDVMAEDGAKLAGAAQRRTRKGILHQGSISLKAGTHEELSEAVKNAFRNEFQLEYVDYVPEDVLMKEAEQLARSKYETKEWIEDGSIPQ